MEVNGIIEMFKKYVELYNVYDEYYIGNGDSKTFTSIKDIEPSDEVSAKKKVRVLHVKKRIYKRAKDARKHLTQIRKVQKLQKMNK